MVSAVGLRHLLNKFCSKCFKNISVVGARVSKGLMLCVGRISTTQSFENMAASTSLKCVCREKEKEMQKVTICLFPF
jgi:hypothetical protein